MALASGPAAVLVLLVSSGRRSRRGLSEEDHRVWAGFTRSVARLPGAAKQPEIESVPKPQIARTGENPRAASVRVKEAPPLASLMRNERQRLARGRQTIDNRIDLHGKTLTEAHGALLRFLRRAQADGARFILVITGKGERLAGEESARDTLRRQVPLWLERPEFSSVVVGFAEADARHGGAGALYVRLRRLGTT